jgi:hypothetical protein
MPCLSGGTRVAGAPLAGVGWGCGIVLAGAALAPSPALTGAADAYVTAFNELSAGADLGVSVASRFATSAR